MLAPWRALGRTYGDVAVEVGAGEGEFLRCAVSQVSDRGRGDVAAPTVFQSHRDPGADAEVTDLLCAREAAELADFEVDDVHREIGPGSKQHVEAVDVL